MPTDNTATVLSREGVAHTAPYENVTIVSDSRVANM